MKFLVTGGAGFIGSHFTELLVNEGHEVIVYDALTYAGHTMNIDHLNNVTFLRGKIQDRTYVERIMEDHRPDALFNFAAESHVCRSIDEPDAFISSNIDGTYQLLRASYAYWKTNHNFKFIQISTDEVFGDLGAIGTFDETSPYRPHSPYSASKASSDHLVRSWHHTYGLPTIVTHCSNNYGSRQYPEKLIPISIIRALNNEPIEIHGKGSNIRDWIHVKDHCWGIYKAYLNGKPGSSYCFGGDAQKTNFDMVLRICAILDDLNRPDKSYENLVTFVNDRPGNDRRYAIDDSKSQLELGWKRERTFDSGLFETVCWYATNQDWCKKITEKK